MYFVSDNMGSAGKGPAIHNFPLWGKVLTFIPGVLLIFYSLQPNSILGRLGKLIFDLYSWVNKQDKK